MSIFSGFYLNDPEEFSSFLPVDLKGGDGGAGARAERDRAEQKQKEARIRKNISLIDVLFENDPEALQERISGLQTEVGGLRDPFNTQIPNPQGRGGFDNFGGPFIEFINQLNDPDKAKRDDLNRRIGDLQEGSGLLTGPTGAQRESQVVGDVSDFFFSDLNEQKIEADKQRRFELSRRGGFGGSQELDALEKFQKKEDKARLDIGNVALNARNDLRAQDAQLKAALIDQANRDISRDVLTSQFTNNLGQGLAQAQDRAKLTRFDPFFETAGNLFTNTSIIKGDQQGKQNAANRIQSFFSANPSRSTGTVRTI